MSLFDQKQKLLNKQDSSTIENRFQQIQDQLQQQIVQIETAGQLMIPSIGVIWEPPLICDWIIDPLKPYLCGEEEGYQGTLKLEVCYYDKTKWNWCFLDPSLTTQHVIKLMQLGVVRQSIANTMGSMLENAGVGDALTIKTVFNFKVIDLLTNIKFINNPSKIKNFQNLYTTLDTVNWNNKQLYRINIENIGEIWFDTLSNLLFGYITGITILGYGLLLDYNEEILDQKIWDWINNKITDSTIRFLPGYSSTKIPPKTPIGYKQTMTYETESWGEKQALKEQVRQAILRKVEKLGLDPIEAQKYVSAAWELLFYFYGPHGEMEDYVKKYKYNLDFDTFLQMWKSKWEAMNLLTSLLEDIVELVRKIWNRHNQITKLNQTAEQLINQLQ